MNNVYTFDPAQFITIVGGVPMQGFADGEFVNFSRKTDTFSESTGVDGDTTRVKSNDKTGILNIVLSMSSPSNDVLSILHNLDERTNKGVVPVVIKDMNGTTTVFSGKGWIRKPSDLSGSKDVTTRTWTIVMANANVFVGGSIPE